MSDPYESHTRDLTTPGDNSQAITPSDAVDLPTTTRALYVGGAGDVAVELTQDAAGSGTTLVAVSAGTLLPLRVRKVLATGTTATALVAIW